MNSASFTLDHTASPVKVVTDPSKIIEVASEAAFILIDTAHPPHVRLRVTPRVGGKLVLTHLSADEFCVSVEVEGA